jgi:hypothetical protein
MTGASVPGKPFGEVRRKAPSVQAPSSRETPMLPAQNHCRLSRLFAGTAAIPAWSLEFEVSLELGCWWLELFDPQSLLSSFPAVTYHARPLHYAECLYQNLWLPDE